MLNFTDIDRAVEEIPETYTARTRDVSTGKVVSWQTPTYRDETSKAVRLFKRAARSAARKVTKLAAGAPRTAELPTFRSVDRLADRCNQAEIAGQLAVRDACLAVYTDLLAAARQAAQDGYEARRKAGVRKLAEMKARFRAERTDAQRWLVAA